MRPTPPGRWPDRDVVASSTGACLFSLALGISSVVLPLLALEAGHQAAVIGLLVSMSAAVQSLTRTMLAAVMRRFADRDLLLIAGVTQAASALAAVISPSVPGLVTAWAVQGVARACFWTGGQTHVARGDRSPMKALALLNLMAGVGQFAGPAVAGLLARESLDVALVVGAVVSACASGASVALDRLPTFPEVDREGVGFWRRTFRLPSTSAAISAGAWRGLLDSFVPVVLRTSGQSVASIGLLVSLGNGAAVAGSVIVARVPPERVRAALSGATVMTGLGLAVASYTAGRPWLAGFALLVAGVGGGALQTLGPSLAALSTRPLERGEAIAAYGTIRSPAALGSPLTASGLSLLMPAGAALFVVACLITLPLNGHRRHLG